MRSKVVDAMVKVTEAVVAEAKEEKRFADAYCYIGAAIQTMLDGMTNMYVNDDITKESEESHMMAVIIAEQLRDMVTNSKDVIE